MPLGKRIAKITNFCIEARTILYFAVLYNLLYVMLLQKKRMPFEASSYVS
jgi:hypothetical protein